MFSQSNAFISGSGLMAPSRVFLFCILVFAGFSILGVSVDRPASDENIYFYHGARLLHGIRPYTDFYFTHPPFFLYTIPTFFSVLGVSFIVLKLIPLTAAFLVLSYTYLLGERIGRWVGAIACTLTLAYSLSFHNLSHINLGIMVTTAFCLMSVYYLFYGGRGLLSGFFAGLALLTRLNAVPVVGILVFIALFKREKEFFKGFFFSVSSLFAFLFSWESLQGFFDSVFLFRLTQDSATIHNALSELLVFLGWNLPIVLAYCIGVPLVFWGGKKSEGMPRLNLLVIPASYIVFVLFFQKSAYSYYFPIILPYITLLAALTFKEIFSFNNRILPVVCVVLFLSSLYSHSLPGLSASYDSLSVRSIQMETDYIKRNSQVGDNVLFLQETGLHRVAVEAGVSIAADFYPEYHRIIAHKKRIHEGVLHGLGMNPSVVAVELRTLQEMINAGVNVDAFMKPLFEDYYPDEALIGDSIVNTLLYFKPRGKGKTPRDWTLREDGENTYYFERTAIPAKGEFLVTDNYQAKNTKLHPFESSYLHGDNPSGLSLIPEKGLIRAIITEHSTYETQKSDDVYAKVFIGGEKDGLINIFALSYDDGNIISLAFAAYAPQLSDFVNVQVFTRLAMPVTTLYHPTYQRVRITREEYEQASSKS